MNTKIFSRSILSKTWSLLGSSSCNSSSSSSSKLNIAVKSFNFSSGRTALLLQQRPFLNFAPSSSSSPPSSSTSTTLLASSVLLLESSKLRFDTLLCEAITGDEANNAVAAAAAALGDSSSSVPHPPLGVVASVLQSTLDFMSSTAAIPWGVGIVLLTVAYRFSMVPMLIFQMRYTARFSAIMPQLTEAYGRQRPGNAFQRGVGIFLESSYIWKQANLHPLLCFATPIVQIPILISVSLAMRELVKSPESALQLSTGGFAWFPDLTLMDATYGLPLLQAAFIFTNLQMINSDRFPILNKLVDVLQLGTILAIPIISQFPAGLVLYWASSTGYTLTQSLVLKLPGVRDKALGEYAPAKMMARIQEQQREKAKQEAERDRQMMEALTPQEREKMNAIIEDAKQQLARVNKLIQEAFDPNEIPTEKMKKKVEKIIKTETEAGRLKVPLKVELRQVPGRATPQLFIGVDRK